MDNARAPRLRNRSRTVAKVAVATLVVIAVAGFVLANLSERQRKSIERPVQLTQQTVTAPTAAASSADEVPAGGPNEVVFAASSVQLPQSANQKVARLAEAAKKERRTVVISAPVESKADRAEQMAIARQRAMAIGGALEGHGVALSAIHIQLTSVPAGSFTAANANRLTVTLQ